MANYRMMACERDGTEIMELPARNIQGECFLNRADTIRWEMPLYVRQLNLALPDIYPGKVEIKLYRGDDIVFAGPMWNVTASSQSGSISCDAEGLESYFDLRRVDWDLEITGEQSAIIWGMMEDSQALTDGELYITDGTFAGAGTVRDFAIRRKEGKYISDVLNDTSGLIDGFDFKIDPTTREFNTWFPHKNSASTVQLEFGAALKSYSIQIMGKWAANDILALGPKEMTDLAIDEAQRATWGLRQTTVSYKDAPNRTALQDFASRTRKARQRGKTIPHLSVRGDIINAFGGDLVLGDTTRILIKDGAVNYDETMRVIGYQYSINLHGHETYVYYFNNMDEVD